MNRSLFAIALIAAGLLPGSRVGANDDPPKPAPAPSPQPKSKPVVLDPATLAKLREVAFDAAREGDLKTLAEYFKAGQPADIVNNRGDTLLILASYHGHDDAVKAILDQPKAPLDARNKMGFTALTGAAYKGYLGIVKQLVAKKADLNASNARKQTPLMFAAMFGRAEVVCYLVDRKVDLKAKDDAGKTALDLARFQGNDEVIKILEAARTVTDTQ